MKHQLNYLGLLPVLLLTSCWEGKSKYETFNDALEDAKTAQVEEIKELVNLVATDSHTLWNEAQNKVLLFAVHAQKNKYQDDTSVTLEEDVWLYSVKEMRDWYLPIRLDVHAKEYRSQQLLGLNMNYSITHVTTFWADANNVYRPAYIKDVTSKMEIGFPNNETDSFKNWFNKQEEKLSEVRPWTKLGYTYDWGNSNHYGLSEFVAFSGSEMLVNKTYTLNNFYSYLETI